MSEIFMKDIIGLHRSKPAIIMGHGPSLIQVSKTLDQKRFSHILFGCNSWRDFYATPPHYWILSSAIDSVKRHKDHIIAKDVPIFFSDVADLEGRSLIKDIPNDYLCFDERHFNNKGCRVEKACCKARVPARLAIQEELRNYCGSTKRFQGGYTVSAYMLSFAILMRCNPIYLVGMEMDYTLGYARQLSGERYKPAIAYDALWSRGWKELIEDFEIINDSAKNIGICILNLSRTSKLKMFPFGKLP